LRVVACGGDGSCVDDEDCDDGDPCSRDYCYSYDPDAPLCEVRHSYCSHSQAADGTSCGSGNVCVDGECGENRCEDVVCEDGDLCTDDRCDYVDGTCDFTPVFCFDGNECTEDRCDPPDGCNFTAVEDVTFCFEDFHPEIGVCKAGACVVAMDACTNAEDLTLVCDPSFMEEVEACGDAAGAFVAPCLVENTGVSADCASCYGTAARCIVENCFQVCPTAPDSQECEDCYVENGCIALLDECTGDLESACDGRDAMSGVGMFEAQP